MGTWYLKWHGYAALLLLCMVLFQGHGVNGNDSGTTSSPSGCSGSSNIPDDCVDAALDLVIVMDASGSVTSSGYQLEKDFVVDVLQGLPVDQTKVRVGIVDYATQVTSNSFSLNTPAYDTFTEICNKVQGFSYANGYTRTDLALQKAKEYLDHSTNNRPGVQDVVLVISDGKTNNGGQNQITQRISELKSIPGIKVITLGVGSTNVDEMKLIATGEPPNYFTVSNFGNLQAILDEILTGVCKYCIGENCSSTIECKGDNVECNGGICLCKDDHILTQHGQCVPCSSVDFTEFLDTFLCADISFCEPEFVLVKDECHGTVVTQSCTDYLNTCTTRDSHCNGTVCVCNDDRVYNGSHCVGSLLGEFCSYDPDSCSQGLVCGLDSNRCECAFPLPIQLLGECVGSRVTEKCLPEYNTCTDCGAICDGGVCTCGPGLVWNATEQICAGSQLCEWCTTDSCATNRVCGDSGRCECLPGALQYREDCFGTRVGERCTTDLNTCVDCGAYCNGSVCVCAEDSYWNGTYCVWSELDLPCDDYPDSCAVNGFVCGPTYRCECPWNKVQVDNMCYALTCENCSSDNECLGSDQTCSYGKCKCENGYYLDNCDICQPKKPDDEDCESDEECQSGFCVCGECAFNASLDCCEEVCRFFPADLVLITDNSGSIGPDNYAVQKTFVQTLLSNFFVSPSVTQVSYIDFSYEIHKAFNLNDYTTNTDVSTQIGLVTFKSGATYTHLALNKAAEFLNSDANRHDVPDYVVLITDGKATNQDLLPASIENLKNASNPTIITVGIGSAINVTELNMIATSPDYVFTVTDFSALQSILDIILTAICGQGFTLVIAFAEAVVPTQLQWSIHRRSGGSNAAAMEHSSQKWWLNMAD